MWRVRINNMYQLRSFVSITGGGSGFKVALDLSISSIGIISTSEGSSYSSIAYTMRMRWMLEYR